MQQITEIFWETQNVQLVLVETGRNASASTDNDSL